MNITNTKLGTNSALRTMSLGVKTEKSGWDSVSPTDFDSFQKTVGSGVLAGVPALGAVTMGISSAGAAIAASFGSEENATVASVAALGTVANVAGTLTLIGGVLTGNGVAITTSLGILGGSAAAGLYVGAKIHN